MGIIYFNKHNSKEPKIEEISIDSFPLIIVTDSHTNLSLIRQLQKFKHKIISLGDFTSLYDVQGKFNKFSIDFFIKEKIPALCGNHESITATLNSTSKSHREYLNNLPDGFKLNLPDGTNYFCFHNRPQDVWSFYSVAPTLEEFKHIYPQINERTRGVIIGHHHLIFNINYPEINCNLIGVGPIIKEEEYAILNEDGITFKKINESNESNT